MILKKTPVENPLAEEKRKKKIIPKHCCYTHTMFRAITEFMSPTGSEELRPDREEDDDFFIEVSSASSSSSSAKKFNISDLKDGIMADHRRSSRVLLQQQAATKFNIKPKEGIAFLIDKNVIIGSPNEVASYLYDHRMRLSKRRLGEYLGSSKDFNRLVCTEFISRLDFYGMALDEALRSLLRTFRLPGEAQQIDRIVEKFAQNYFLQNSGVFTNSDTVFILSFSLIMLNTDLHNESVATEKKMSLDDFIRNNREIDGGKDLPIDLLSELYKNIKENEIRMHETDQYESSNISFMAPIKAGWLMKEKRNFFRSTKIRWFVLNDGCLYYFNQPRDNVPRGIIPLDNIAVEFSSSSSNNKLSKTFTLTSSSGGVIKSSKLASGVMKRGTRSTFRLETADENDRDEWVKVLQGEAARFRPMHDIFIRLQEKKGRKGELRKTWRSSLYNKSKNQTNKQEGSEVLLHLPKPLARGWMQKKSNTTSLNNQSSQSNSSGWSRRYFVLFPDFDDLGATLFYFISRESAQMMIDLGQQTQSGYLRMKEVTKVSLYTEEDHIPSIRVDISSTTTNTTTNNNDNGSNDNDNSNASSPASSTDTKDTTTTTTTTATNTTNDETTTVTSYWIFVPEAAKEADNDYDSVYESDLESTADSSTMNGSEDEDISWEFKAQQWYEALSRTCVKGQLLDSLSKVRVKQKEEKEKEKEKEGIVIA